MGRKKDDLDEVPQRWSYRPDVLGGGDWVVEKVGLADMPISPLAKVLLQLRKAARMFS
jgi:hypothetical protein